MLAEAVSEVHFDTEPYIPKSSRLIKRMIEEVQSQRKKSLGSYNGGTEAYCEPRRESTQPMDGGMAEED